MALSMRGVEAIEILDSRGRPTLAVTLTLSDGAIASWRAVRRVDRLSGGGRVA